MMVRAILSFSALAALFAAGPIFAADLTAETPSVAVETVALKQQPMTAALSGYGVVSPDTRARETISLPRPGQIVSLPLSAGQVVKKGDVLLSFGTAADASLAYRQAQEAQEFARGELVRTEQLASQQLATQSQLSAAKKALAGAQGALQAQERIGAGKALESVAAPFDGVVLSVLAAQGERLASGAPVLMLARSGKSRVVLGIEPDQVARLRPGMLAEVAPVFDPQRKVRGRVAQVFGVINPQTQFVDVLVELPDKILMPGTRVLAEIHLDSRAAWVVPRSAVLTDAQSAYIFQVRAGKAQRINVRTGLERNGLIAVQGAFDPKQRVVSLGNYELHDGMAVREGAQ